MIEGIIRGLGQVYASGEEGLEIRIERPDFAELPLEVDGAVPIGLTIDGERYEASLRATSANKYVWISAKVRNKENARLTLAQVLRDHGLSKNQRLELQALGNELTIQGVGGESARKLKPQSERVFGPIEGIVEGATFKSRAELQAAGLHRQMQAGISGSQHEGADAIVLSGGYEDDLDYGDEVIYTGHGGQDPKTREQIADQELVRQNLALAVSMQQGLLVRVIRGAKLNSEFAPESGYRYDGLYRVDEMWHEIGRAGYRVYRFRLNKLDAGRIPRSDSNRELRILARGSDQPERTSALVGRIARDSKLSRQIKDIYDYTCQMCGTRLEGPAGPYAESAHIRPLGRPHDGPDVSSNIICLCPNHHVLFDLGAIVIADNFSLIGDEGCLSVDPAHEIRIEYLRYHREHFGPV